MTKLVRVGHPPGIYEATDRWGVPSGRFYANEYGLMWESAWERVQDFQTMPVMSEEDREAVLAVGHLAAFERALHTGFAREIDRKLRLNPERCTVWQLEVQVPRGVPGDFIRVAVVFGELRLVRWRLRDVLALPFWRWRARRRTRAARKQRGAI